ncbi:hypothetical protein CJ010_11365 [Azoarcus sp. DD4]|nr:hypothetical protein CJ010_11365 [Azoarcus sp. DD4]
MMVFLMMTVAQLAGMSAVRARVVSGRRRVSRSLVTASVMANQEKGRFIPQMLRIRPVRALHWLRVSEVLTVRRLLAWRVDF